MMICGMRFDSLMASGCRFRALMRTLRALQLKSHARSPKPSVALRQNMWHIMAWI